MISGSKLISTENIIELFNNSNDFNKSIIDEHISYNSKRNILYITDSYDNWGNIPRYLVMTYVHIMVNRINNIHDSSPNKYYTTKHTTLKIVYNSTFIDELLLNYLLYNIKYNINLYILNKLFDCTTLLCNFYGDATEADYYINKDSIPSFHCHKVTKIINGNNSCDNNFIINFTNIFHAYNYTFKIRSSCNSYLLNNELYKLIHTRESTLRQYTFYTINLVFIGSAYCEYSNLKRNITDMTNVPLRYVHINIYDHSISKSNLIDSFDAIDFNVVLYYENKQMEQNNKNIYDDMYERNFYYQSW